MTELEAGLARLGAEIAFPETPNVAAAVRRRLDAAPARRFAVPSRRSFVLAFVVLALAVGAALAVPPARTAILEWLGLRGATVERVDTLPEAPTGAAADLQLGRSVSLEQAQELVAFDVLLPEELGEPDGLFYSSFPEGGRISLVYRPREDLPRSRQTGVGLLVTQFRGDLSPDFVGKLADQSVRLLPTSVGEFPAIWLEGGPHVVYFRDRSGVVVEDAVRLAGNTLLLEHGRTLVRLEGTLGQERAEEIAASLRPAG